MPDNTNPQSTTAPMTPKEAEKAVKAVEVVQELKKQTGTVGFGQIGNTTPNWATWMFRIYFYLVQFASIILAFLTEVPAELKVKIIGWLQVSTIAVHGFSKMWGIDTKKIQQQAIEAFNQQQ